MPVPSDALRSVTHWRSATASPGGHHGAPAASSRSSVIARASATSWALGEPDIFYFILGGRDGRDIMPGAPTISSAYVPVKACTSSQEAEARTVFSALQAILNISKVNVLQKYRHLDAKILVGKPGRRGKIAQAPCGDQADETVDRPVVGEGKNVC